MEEQTKKFQDALDNKQSNPAFLEFGGKPFENKLQNLYHGYEADHALNLAFEAATADLGNKVLDIRENRDNKNFRTSYDKDVQNFALLKRMFEIFGKEKEVEHIRDAVDMGINRIVDGIIDMNAVIEACGIEIRPRILRYESELSESMEELKTVEMAREVLGRFEKIYQVKTNFRSHHI